MLKNNLEKSIQLVVSKQAQPKTFLDYFNSFLEIPQNAVQRMSVGIYDYFYGVSEIFLPELARYPQIYLRAVYLIEHMRNWDVPEDLVLEILAELEAIDKSNPPDPIRECIKGLLKLSYFLDDQEKKIEGLQELRMSIELDPKNPVPHHIIAQHFMLHSSKIMELQQAVHHYKQVIAIMSTETTYYLEVNGYTFAYVLMRDVHKQYAIVLEKLGYFKEAYAELIKDSTFYHPPMIKEQLDKNIERLAKLISPKVENAEIKIYEQTKAQPIQKLPDRRDKVENEKIGKSLHLPEKWALWAQELVKDTPHYANSGLSFFKAGINTQENTCPAPSNVTSALPSP